MKMSFLSKLDKSTVFKVSAYSWVLLIISYLVITPLAFMMIFGAFSSSAILYFEKIIPIVLFLLLIFWISAHFGFIVLAKEIQSKFLLITSIFLLFYPLILFLCHLILKKLEFDIMQGVYFVLTISLVLLFGLGFLKKSNSIPYGRVIGIMYILFPFLVIIGSIVYILVILFFQTLMFFKLSEKYKNIETSFNQIKVGV